MSLRDDDIARLILRLSVGFLLLSHGIHKLVDGIDPVISMVEDVGLPAWFAYGVYIGEVIAPLLLIVGYYGRIAALVIVFTMANAIYLAHRDDIFVLDGLGAPVIELPMLYLLSALAIFLLGTGRYSIDQR